jgi:hypothetical protein
MISWHFAAAEQVWCVALVMPYSTADPAEPLGGRVDYFSAIPCYPRICTTTGRSQTAQRCTSEGGLRAAARSRLGYEQT